MPSPLRCSVLPIALLLAACGSTDESAPAAAASVPASAPTAAALDSNGLPLAPGEWQVSEDASGVRASFQAPDGKGLLSLSCDMASKTITLAVANATPGNTAFVLQSGGTAARLDTVADNNTADPRQIAAIAPDAPVFVGFVQPGGSITITQPGGMSLHVPATSGIGRVFEGCR